MSLSKKHQKTPAAIFQTPAPSDVPWDDIVKLLATHGAEITEGRGSRVRIALEDVRAVFHRPHPRKETDKGALRSMKQFLTEAGVKAC